MKEEHNRRRAKTRDNGDKLKVIRLVNCRLKEAVDYGKFRLEDASPKYNTTVSKNVAKMAKRMTALMKPHTFDPFHLISILVILKNFKLACSTSGIQEGAAM